MNIDLSIVKETMEINKEELKGNRELTNELLIDDIMLALGYNKKRNTGVKRIYGSDVDWDISINEQKRFVIKTIGYEDSLAELGIEQTADMENYDLSIITNGKILNIYNLKIDKANPILSISITDESEDVVEVLKYLSFEEYSNEKIIEIYERTLINNEKIRVIIKDNIDEVSKSILSLGGFEANERNIKAINESFLMDSESNSSEVEQLKAEITSIKAETENKTKEFEDKISEIKLELENKQSELAEVKGKLEYKESEILEIKKKIETPETDKENESIKIIDELNTRISNLTSKIDELEGEKKLNTDTINRLSSQIENSHKAGGEALDVNSDTIIEFRKKITQLEEDKALLQEEIGALKKNIHGLQNSGAEQEKEINDTAKSLLEAIQDNPELDRSYVAVINTKLLQNEDLNKFIGSCIEELYGIVGFKLMPKLFDGDIFQLIQKPERKDFSINNKSYDINLEGLQEDEVLVKLAALFEKFSGVLLNCKTIGTKKDTTEDIEVHFDEDEDIVVDEKLICVTLDKLGNVMWSDEVKLFDIEYVGYEDCIVGKIASTIDSDGDYYSIVLSKVLDSIMSLSSNLEEGIANLRKIDLSKVSKYLEIINNVNKRNPRVSLTRFIINDIDSITKYVPIINEIANAVGVDKSKTKIYFRGSVQENSEAEQYIVTEDSLVFEDGTEYTGDGSNESKQYALITGTITDNVVLTRKSLKIQSEMFEKCLIVKTNSIEEKLETEEDIIKVVTLMIDKGVAEGNEFKSSVIGKVLDSENMFISNLVNEVTEEHLTATIQGTEYYISKMEDWQLIYALIKLHTIMFRSKSIGLKVQVNESAYNFYANEYKDCDASARLAVKSLVSYVGSRMK